MITKKKTGILIGISIACAVLLLAGVFCLLYFVYQIPWFDRGGWQTGEVTQYWDYYGRPMKGWTEIEGKTYYFHPETGNLCTGWLETDQGIWFLDESGVKQTGWIEADGQRYYLDGDGVLQTGWLDTAEGRYYLLNTGAVQTGWQDLPDGRYYFGDTGLMHTGWLEAQEGKYYFSDAGILHTGWLTLPEGKYYFSEAGILQTGWVDTREGRFYLDEQGLLQASWIQTEDGLYYINADGQPHTGWLVISGKKWYLDETGKMQTGWITTPQGRYYFHGDGTMAAGFVELDGIWRYFTPEGEYIPLVNPWNAVPEDFALELVSLEGFSVDISCREPLSELVKDCRKAGYQCALNSTYRSISTQKYLWNKRYNNYISQGYSQEEAKKLTWNHVAYPGTSEHQLGLAVDIVGTDALYDWLAEHSWEYGFIVRYPEDKIEITGIVYEPWHIRYVGKSAAKEIYESGLTLEEYLEALK